MGFRIWTVSGCALLILALSSIDPSTAFPVTRATPTMATAVRWSSLLQAKTGSNDNDDDDSENKDPDIESAREQLESLMGRSMESNTGFVDIDDLVDPNSPLQLPPSPPMTSLSRDRRLQEMDALEKLLDGDEAMKELWDMWFSERGHKAKVALQKTDAMISDPDGWGRCEEELKGLIQEHGVFWVEPINRLATLYFLQSRYEKSYKLCRVVLRIKPWHFGALSGIVGVCIAMGNREEAREWAMKRLPPAVASTSFPPFEKVDGPSNPDRQNWVETALAQARDALSKSEQITEEALGHPESYYSDGFRGESTVLDDDPNDWQ